MRVRGLLLVCLFLVLGFAPAPFPRSRREDPGKDDLRRMQGTWVVVRYQAGKRDLVPLIAPRTFHFEFEGNRLRLVLADAVPTTWRLTLSSTSVPRGFDRTRDDDSTTF